MIPLKVLIADDEPDLRNYIRHILTIGQKRSIHFVEVENGHQAVQAVHTSNFDLIFLDVKMPVMDGLTALQEIMQLQGDHFVVMITAHGNVRDAVNAIKDGAYDYLEKPLDKEKILQMFDKAVETRQLFEEISLSFPILESDVDSEIIGHSKPMRDVFELIKKISNTDSTILLRGENGTGKELVAKAIHFNSSRKNEEMIAVNCAAIPDGLVESELFGHEKGAFTDASERKIGKFQLANNGTLFLDEIGEIKFEIQAKLLRVLQDKTFTPVGSTRVQKSNARIIAATNQNLERLIEDGLFREDLYFRLNVIPIFIPPLRDRSEDIPSLIQYFLKKYNQENQVNAQFSPAAMEKLKNHLWPGNIRELENVIQRSVILTAGPIIDVTDLPATITHPKKSESESSNTALDFEQFKVESEKAFIERALAANDGKINRTVANANIPKNTLLRKIKKYGIKIEPKAF